MNRKKASETTSPTDYDKTNIDWQKQKLANKKIYFDADETEIKIGYDDQTGIGFVEIITD